MKIWCYYIRLLMLLSFVTLLNLPHSYFTQRQNRYNSLLLSTFRRQSPTSSAIKQKRWRSQSLGAFRLHFLLNFSSVFLVGNGKSWDVAQEKLDWGEKVFLPSIHVITSSFSFLDRIICAKLKKFQKDKLTSCTLLSQFELNTKLLRRVFEQEKHSESSARQM